MSAPAEKDFEDLRVHFSDRQWKKLKDVEKIIYWNQKSNHLFKLSVGLNSKVPDFMRTSDDEDDDEADAAPKPKRKKIDGPSYNRPDCPSDKELRIRTKVVNYKESTLMDWEVDLRNERKMQMKMEKRKRKKTCMHAKHEKKMRRENRKFYCYSVPTLDKAAFDRSLRNRTNAVTYTEVPEDDGNEEEWSKSGSSGDESISSDEESEQETSTPQPSKKKKRRREESDDEQSIPSDEESGDATETVNVVSPRVSVLRLSVDYLRAKMQKGTSAPRPSKEEECKDEPSTPSDEESGDATETRNVVSPRVGVLRLSVDYLRAKMQKGTSTPWPSKEECKDEPLTPSDEDSGDATETRNVVSPRVSVLRLSVDSIRAKMQTGTSAPRPSKEEECKDEPSTPSAEDSSYATEP